MLLQVLRTLKSFATEVALVWLQGYVDADMRGDMVALDGGCPTIAPLTSQVKVVCTLATNMTLANMVLDDSEFNSVAANSSCSYWVNTHVKLLRARGSLPTAIPLTLQSLEAPTLRRRRRSQLLRLSLLLLLLLLLCDDR